MDKKCSKVDSPGNMARYICGPEGAKSGRVGPHSPIASAAYASE